MSALKFCCPLFVYSEVFIALTFLLSGNLFIQFQVMLVSGYMTASCPTLRLSTLQHPPTRVVTYITRSQNIKKHISYLISSFLTTMQFLMRNLQGCFTFQLQQTCTPSTYISYKILLFECFRAIPLLLDNSILCRTTKCIYISSSDIFH